MDEQYWDEIAGRFVEAVLEIAEADLHGVLREEIRALAQPGRTAADLGCGPGSLLPLLAEAFVHVEAVDHSAKLLEMARKRHGRPNVRFHKGDLGGGSLPGVQADVVFCVNVLLAPKRKTLERIAATVREALRPDGAAVFVVPSLECVLHVFESLARCRRRDGKPSGLSRKKAEAGLREVVVDWVEGVVDISGVPTKHWTRAALEGFLEDAGFEIERTRRVPYPWQEELEEVPDWLESRPPWDWLVVARRAK